MRLLTMGLALWLMLPTLASATSAESVEDRPPYYTLGVVPQFAQRQLFKVWQPILSELEARTGFKLKLVGNPTIPVFEKRFMMGQYDFAYMNPYHVLKASKSQGYIPLVRDNSRQLFGVLVVRNDSAVESVEGLEKKTIAFPAPNALGASLLMRADLDDLFGITFFPRYVKTHSSVYLNVALGQTTAGGGVMSTLNAQPEEIRQRLKVIYQTRGMPPHPVVAHPRVSAADRETFRQAWLEFAKTPRGAELMSKIPMAEPVETSIADYQPMQEWGLDAYYVSDF